MRRASAEIVWFCKMFLHVDDMPIRASQFAVLNIMCTTPGPHVPARLAEELGVSKAMISAHLSGLIKMGYVVRVPSPEDGRSVYVMPSKRGKDLFNKISRQKDKRLNDIKSAVGADEFDDFVKTVEKINVVLREG